MKPLPRAKPGNPGSIKPDSWNRVIDELEAIQKRITALTPHKSPDIIHKSSKNGFTSHLTRRGGKGAGGGNRNLTIKKGTAVDKFQIIPGYVNGEMPTLGGITLDATTKPEFTIAVDTWAWIKCVGTFGAPDTYVVTIETSTTDAVPAGTDISATGFVSFFYIGNIVIDTAPDPDTYTITNEHSGGNLGVDSWGLYNLWWRS